MNIPKVTIIDEETYFGIIVQTDEGADKINLQGARYDMPYFWQFEGHTWMWLTAFYTTPFVETEVPLLVTNPALHYFPKPITKS